MSLVGAVLSVLLAAAPAQGVGVAPAVSAGALDGVTGDAVTVTTRDVTGYNTSCFGTTVVATPSFDASDTGTWDGHWSAVVQVEDPSGELYTRSYDGTAASRAFAFRLCGDYGLVGTYEVAALWEQHDAEGASIANGYTFGSFQYTLKPRAVSRLSVTKDRYGSSGWKFGGRLTRAGRPYARQRVQVWIRLNGSWVNFEETKRTNDRGRVSWHTARTLGRNSYVFQLRYPGNTRTKPDRSSTFRLPGR